MQDNKTDRYFGFVNFETAEAAVTAKEKLHDQEMDGSKLFVDRAQTKAERSDMLKRRYEQKRSALAQEWEGKNVYVKNLSADVDETMLKEAFSVRTPHNTLLLRSSVFSAMCEWCLARLLAPVWALAPYASPLVLRQAREQGAGAGVW